ncbi:MAG: primosomal protein N' [Caldilineaceae bacterium]|nr:primosomal protein N' [Caldilineaceae bacterium]
MQFVEVVVNVPIRRSFGRAQPPQLEELEVDNDALQTFHYHLPPDLEEIVRPGHLVWVPFGGQELQAIVLRRTPDAPVVTKPILRLARPVPVLTGHQMELAAWMAHEYVAPFSEAIKLFLPPGLLARRSRDVHAKREWRVHLHMAPEAARAALAQLGHSNGQATILAHLMAHPAEEPGVKDLMQACQLKTDSAVRSLARRGAVQIEDQRVRLLLSPGAATELLLALRGAAKYVPVVEELIAASGPLWKSALQAQRATDLDALRTLQKAGIVELREEVRFRDPLNGRTFEHTRPPEFTVEQKVVWAAVCERGFAQQAPAHFLLHGVTGSGKTEIYLRAIEETLRRGRQSIVLVPEIALTPQTVARFAGRFPGQVTVIHSELSTGERYDVWRALRDGAYSVVVGPRSALFAPLDRLGLIVIDEEHEMTYKQDAEEWGSFKVFYDARTVARRLARLTDSVLILGSATPSLESYYAAEQDELVLLEMPRRVMGHRGTGAGHGIIYGELPPVEVVDMRQELRAGNRSIFSRSLASELIATLDAGEQAILFLNRRGTNTFVMCRDCGHVEECPRCETPLTYHEPAGQLICHRCNRHYPVPDKCPNPACNSKRIRYFGTGTERIEETVKEIVPRARVLRWDADTTGRKGSHEAIMHRFANHDADVLVGTQMIAKGLDLPMVTLVGVVAADVGLFLPDFRSGERTFQLLTQVSGRAGRSQRRGRVVIQTYRPDHYAIQAAAQHDYAAFYAREMSFRAEQGYPPMRRLAKLIFWEKRLDRAKAESERMATVLRHRLVQMGLEGQSGEVMGPAPAFFGRYRGYYRWQIILRTPDPPGVLRGLDIPFGWRIDVDPVSLL